MWKEATFNLPVVCLAVVSWLQDKPKADQEKSLAEFKVTPEVASRKNPVTSNPSSIAEGKRPYGFECAVYLGSKGDLAGSMKVKLRDSGIRRHLRTSLTARSSTSSAKVQAKYQGKRDG